METLERGKWLLVGRALGKTYDERVSSEHPGLATVDVPFHQPSIELRRSSGELDPARQRLLGGAHPRANAFVHYRPDVHEAVMDLFMGKVMKFVLVDQLGDGQLYQCIC